MKQLGKEDSLISTHAFFPITSFINLCYYILGILYGGAIMAALKAGDRVILCTREVSQDDIKTGLYYAYFGGLIGSVDRIYDDNTVCVDIDLDSLRKDMKERHLAVQEAERKRWLDSISDEMRNRLNHNQKQLKMSYKILVSAIDIQTYKGPGPDGSQTKKSNKTEDNKPQTTEAADNAASVVISAKNNKESEPHRLTAAELAAKEEEYLLKRMQDLSK